MTMVGWKLHMSPAPALVILVDFSTNAEGENNSYDLESKSNDWKVRANAIFAEKKLYISGRYCKPIIPNLCYACKLFVENENH